MSPGTEPHLASANEETEFFGFLPIRNSVWYPTYGHKDHRLTSQLVHKNEENCKGLADYLGFYC